MIRFKSAELTDVKAEGLDGSGEFTGYAAVWDNVDSYGDVTRRGAFAESLKSFGDNGAGVPTYWSHRLDDPEMNIGQTVEAVEDDHGLRVRVRLDMDSPKAAYVHKLITQGRVRQMSFAYAVTDGSIEKGDEGEFFEIRAAELFEVSIVPIGANPLAELTGSKAVADLAQAVTVLKAGRRNSKADADKIRQIRDLADELLAEAQGGEDEEETPDPSEDGQAAKRRDALAKLAQLHNEKEE